MKISIITVCYNSGATIRDTIESVLSQTYPDIEHIIVDGASTDNTMAIVNSYQDRIQKIISKPDNGIYDAMNNGIAVATGDVIGILNSDDFFSGNDIVEKIAACFSDRNVDGIYADVTYVDREDPRKPVRLYSSRSFALWKIRFGWMLPHPTFYVRREFYERYGAYKTNYRVAADFELITRFVTKGRIRLKRLPYSIVKMRQGGISSTGLWWRIHQNIEIAQACRENGIYSNLLFMVFKLPFKLMSYVADAR